MTDKEKLELYSRTKAFLFPSSREGFGIALAESLQLGMAAVIWRLLCLKNFIQKAYDGKARKDHQISREGELRIVLK